LLLVLGDINIVGAAVCQQGILRVRTVVVVATVTIVLQDVPAPVGLRAPECDNFCSFLVLMCDNVQQRLRRKKRRIT
jgi:hypothetical protein